MPDSVKDLEIVEVEDGRVCPAPGGCVSCPDPSYCRGLRVGLKITTIEEEEAFNA